MKTSEILNVKVNHNLTFNDAINMIEEKLHEKSFFQVCTTNPEFVVDAQNDKRFLDIINSSYLSLPDGSGILFAIDYIDRVKLLKRDVLFPLKSFFAGIATFRKVGKFIDFPPLYGAELTELLIKHAAEHGYTIGLIGGSLKDKRGRLLPTTENIAQVAAKKLTKKYPNLKIAIAESDLYASAVNDASSLSSIMTILNKNNITHIDMLFVGFGHNKQEKWIRRNHENLPVSLCMGVGGTLDDIAGYTKKPSDFYTKYNLRWLYRFFHQPWRFKRILKATLMFPLLVFLDTLKQQ
jgi:N-acetylglucosaminyldiphosphoundecaprenol N-acetyl-beta-D-mannosaminyltransferase